MLQVVGEPEPGTFELTLSNARNAGIITDGQFLEKLRAHREAQVARPAAPPQRAHGTAMVASLRHLWAPADGMSFPTRAEAAKNRENFVHGGNGGHWAWNQTGMRSLMHCNAHEGCKVQLRVARAPGQNAGEISRWRLEATDGIRHSIVPKDKTRANSANKL